MTPAQTKAARALLDWSQGDLAAAAGLGLSTIVDFERERRVVSADAVRAIKSAFQAADVEFIDDARGEGVVKLKQQAFDK
ncbi:MAG: XRE family transcriptional regulator [Methylobacterium sp.]|nr:XRE family transcriptional regulator [Methylobacterium sp.]